MEKNKLEQEPSTIYPPPSLYFVFIIGFFALSINTNGFLALLPFITEEYTLSKAQAGLYSTFLFTTSTVLAVFSGKLVDNLGTRVTIPLGLITLAAFKFLYIFSPTFSGILILTLFTGFGFSIITPSANKGIATKIHPSKRAYFTGIVQSGLGIGGFVGAGFLPFLGEIISWRGALVVSTTFAFMVGLIVYFLYQDGDKHFNNLKGKQDKYYTSSQSPSLKKQLLILLRNKNLIWIFVIGALFGSSVSAFHSHFALFLHLDLGLRMSLAGLGFGLYQIGGIAGRPFWGWTSDHLFSGDRGITLFIIGITIGLLLLCTSILPLLETHTFVIYYVFAFFLGFTSFGWASLHLTTIAEIAGMENTGTVTGLALVFIRTGIAVTPPLIGMGADCSGSYSYSWLILGLITLTVSIIFRITYKTSNL